MMVIALLHFHLLSEILLLFIIPVSLFIRSKGVPTTTKLIQIQADRKTYFNCPTHDAVEMLYHFVLNKDLYQSISMTFFSVITFQMWISFGPIADLTSKYYGVGYLAVNWLSLVYLVVSIPIGLAATWLLDTLGLRVSVRTGLSF